MTSRTALIVLLGALMALGPLSIDAYLPALPAIEAELHGVKGSAELTLASYFAGMALSQLFWGLLADRLGRRAPLALGLVTFILGSVACAAAPTMETLVAARAAQGVGGAAGIVVVRAVVRDLWTSREAAQVLSRLLLVMGVAPIVAPLLGNVILAFSTWRAVFVMLVVAAAALAVACWWLLPDTRGSTPAIPGAWRSTIADPGFWWFTLAGGSASAAMFAYIAASAMVFQEELHVPPVVFSLIFGLNAAALIGAAQVNAVLVRRYPPVVVAQWAAAAMVVVAGCALALVGTLGPTPAIEVALLLFLGLVGFIGANTTVAALESQGARAGLASGLLGAVQFAMSAAGSALVGQIPASHAVALAIVLVVASLSTVLCLTAGSRTLA